MSVVLRLLDHKVRNVELEGLTPASVALQSLADLQRRKICCGRRSVELGALFDVTGKPDSGIIRMIGDLQHVHWIGAGMNGGAIVVEGNVGRHAGSGMKSGELQIDGNTGDWLGAEMSGGRIRVSGNAGHLAGAGYRGSVRGMRGGELLIRGDVGDETGAIMRRGLIAVGGNCGEFVGYGMIAGSIAVHGHCGARPGAGMKRGTIALTGRQEPPKFLPGFAESSPAGLTILRLLSRYLADLGMPQFLASGDVPVRVIRGDRVVDGQGEILVVREV